MSVKEDELKQKDEEIARLNSELSNVQTDFDKLKEEHAELQDKVKKDEGAIDNTKTDVDSLLMSFLNDSTFARKKVIDYMVNEYTSPLSPYKTMADRLDNAMSAMRRFDEDGEPIQVNGHPFMFVGTVGK